MHLLTHVTTTLDAYVDIYDCTPMGANGELAMALTDATDVMTYVFTGWLLISVTTLAR